MNKLIITLTGVALVGAVFAEYKAAYDINNVPAIGQNAADVRGDKNAGHPRLLILGNSVTRHGPRPEIGWTNDWGMAATALEKDFAHVLAARVKAAFPSASFALSNVADTFERSFQKGIALERAFGWMRDWQPDAVIFFFGANCPKEYDAKPDGSFGRELERLRNYLANGRPMKVFMSEGFYRRAVLDGEKKALAAKYGDVFVPMDDVRSRDDVRGGYGHPSDFGMRLIAERFWRELRPVLASAFAAEAAKLPPLAGDGVTDDTAAIQARLDSGVSCVYLPPPPKEYLISRTLRLGSGTELRLDRFTRIRLAPHSDCLMLANREADAGGSRALAVTGGIWDFDNLRQGANPGWRHVCKPPQPRVVYTAWSPTNYIGMIMSFRNATNVCVRGVTFRNPVTYCCQFTGAADIVVDDVTFDFETWNPIRGNMDGIHLDGPCTRARLTNLRGTCFDDMVALNADDGPSCSPGGGDISDVVVDGLQSDYCHSGVRLLSAPHACRRITIRNLFGRYFTYAVGFTHYFPARPRGTIEDVVVENVFCEKSLAPEELGVHSRQGYAPIYFEGPLDVGSVTIRNFVRDEKTLPVASILVREPTVVRHLTVRDCKMGNGLGRKIPFLENRGKIGQLTVENIDYLPSPEDWICP